MGLPCEWTLTPVPGEDTGTRGYGHGGSRGQVRSDSRWSVAGRQGTGTAREWGLPLGS